MLGEQQEMEGNIALGEEREQEAGGNSGERTPRAGWPALGLRAGGVGFTLGAAVTVPLSAASSLLTPVCVAESLPVYFIR